MKLTSLGSSKRRLGDGGRTYPHNCNSRENVVGVISSIGPSCCFPGGQEINLGVSEGTYGITVAWQLCGRKSNGGRRLMWSL